MRVKRAWTVQSLFICVVLNGILLAGFFFLARQSLLWLQQLSAPFVGSGSVNLPGELNLALTNLNDFLAQTELYLAVVAFGFGGMITLILWFFIQLRGRHLLDRVKAEPVVSTGPDSQAATVGHEVLDSQADYAQPSPEAAIQMLSILQRRGRLIDFLQENLSRYDDAQIGAAVRNIHQGCKDALDEYLELEPIFSEEEDSQVTVPAGFDSRSIRLTGNVVGSPPFQGIVRHRGWRTLRVQLPKPISLQKEDWVLAPAEVEIRQ